MTRELMSCIISLYVYIHHKVETCKCSSKCLREVLSQKPPDHFVFLRAATTINTEKNVTLFIQSIWRHESRQAWRLTVSLHFPRRIHGWWQTNLHRSKVCKELNTIRVIRHELWQLATFLRLSLAGFIVCSYFFYLPLGFYVWRFVTRV